LGYDSSNIYSKYNSKYNNKKYVQQIGRVKIKQSYGCTDRSFLRAYARGRDGINIINFHRIELVPAHCFLSVMPSPLPPFVCPPSGHPALKIAGVHLWREKFHFLLLFN
jgi:hypothetical protein